VKVIVESRAIVMIIAVNKPEYFLLSLKAGNHPLGFSPHFILDIVYPCWFLVTFTTWDLKMKLASQS